jgi:large subunit ribosomal protein L28
MAMRCQKCGKGVQYGHYVSHAKNRVKRVFKPNLKRVSIMVNGKKTRLVLCAQCVKAVKKASYK